MWLLKAFDKSGEIIYRRYKWKTEVQVRKIIKRCGFRMITLTKEW